MSDAFYLLKSVNLIFLLVTLFGCTNMPSVSMPKSIPDAVEQGKVLIGVQTEKGMKDDKYCDLFEETSYDVTDNVVSVVLSSNGLQTIQDWQRGGFTGVSTGGKSLQKVAENVSKDYVWMPVSFEESLGDHLQARLEKDSKILDRNARRNRTLYNKVDAALEKAKKDYTKLPYKTKLYIIDSDQINAEALPAGYIYVTRQAANDLDDNALQLVLGHEMAHIAKRHTSKQIQQRLVETGLAAEMLQQIMERRSALNINTFVSADRVIDSFKGKFAKYDQGQELQADACSVRGLLSAGTDPLKAREEYVRKRGTEETKESKSPSPKSAGVNLTEHPTDKERDRFFQQAYQHHRQKKQMADSGPVLR